MLVVSKMKTVTMMLALLITSSSAIADESLSPSQVLLGVKTRGAGKVVLEIWASESKTRTFLAGVGSGKHTWLLAAQAIAPATDAGSAEELSDALAEALLNNPYGTLPWLRQYWWSGRQQICVFAQDSELPGGVLAYTYRLETALSKSSSKKFADIRQRCQQGIEETRKRLMQSDA